MASESHTAGAQSVALASCSVHGKHLIVVFLFSQCSRQMIPGLMKKPKLPEAFKQSDCNARNWLQRRWQSWKPNGARGGSPEASRKTAVGWRPGREAVFPRGQVTRVGLKPQRTRPLPGCYLNKDERGEIPLGLGSLPHPPVSAIASLG